MIEIQLLTVPQTAGVLKLSIREVWRRIKVRELTTVRIGRATRVPHSSLIDFIERHTNV